MNILVVTTSKLHAAAVGDTGERCAGSVRVCNTIAHLVECRRLKVDRSGVNAIAIGILQFNAIVDPVFRQSLRDWHERAVELDEHAVRTRPEERVGRICRNAGSRCHVDFKSNDDRIRQHTFRSKAVEKVLRSAEVARNVLRSLIRVGVVPVCTSRRARLFPAVAQCKTTDKMRLR